MNINGCGETQRERAYGALKKKKWWMMMIIVVSLCCCLLLSAALLLCLRVWKSPSLRLRSKIKN
jgi:hypothetical protein